MRAPSMIVLAPLVVLMWIFMATDRVLADEAADFTLCHQATAMAEHVSGVPDQLLDAISRVETGRYDENQGSVRAWPWTINAEGQGHFYASKREAVEAATQFRARGVRSMDVGCTQINLMFHPDAFGSLEDAFDPVRNATFAARFLTELFQQAGSWPHAAAAYHSQTPELGTDYQHKVLEAWSSPLFGDASNQSSHGSRPHLAHFDHQPADHQPASHQLAGIQTRSQGSTPTTFLASSRPFGRNLAGSPGGSTHSFQGVGGLSGVGGRALSAYRAMPVAMLTRLPHPARY